MKEKCYSKPKLTVVIMAVEEENAFQRESAFLYGFSPFVKMGEKEIQIKD